MPYDTFVRMQLAGDEIRPGDPAAFIATGFNRCYPDMVDLNDQGLRRQNALNDITETTGLVFLGLTIGLRGATTISLIRSAKPTSTGLRPFLPPRDFATITRSPRSETVMIMKRVSTTGKTRSRKSGPR